jgi:hypothetical protein
VELKSKLVSKLCTLFLISKVHLLCYSHILILDCNLISKLNVLITGESSCSARSWHNVMHPRGSRSRSKIWHQDNSRCLNQYNILPCIRNFSKVPVFRDVYMHTYTCIYTYIYTYIHKYIHLCVCTLVVLSSCLEKAV